jgi:hypothetical protein
MTQMVNQTERQKAAQKAWKVSISEMDVGKIQPGLPLAIEAQAHALVRERLAHVIGFAFVRQEAARGDPLDFAVGRIHERFVLLI